MKPFKVALCRANALSMIVLHPSYTSCSSFRQALGIPHTETPA